MADLAFPGGAGVLRLRRLVASPLPLVGMPLTDRWFEPVLLTGAAMATYGLAYFAALGFAPDGRFPWITALLVTVGVGLVALHPTKVSRAVPAAPTTG